MRDHSTRQGHAVDGSFGQSLPFPNRLNFLYHAGMTTFVIGFYPRGTSARDGAGPQRQAVEAPDRSAAFLALLVAHPGATIERIDELERVPAPADSLDPSAESLSSGATAVPILRAAPSELTQKRQSIGRASVIAWLSACVGLLLARLLFKAFTQPRAPDWAYRPAARTTAPNDPTPFVIFGHVGLTSAALLCLAIGVTQALRRAGVPGVIALPLGLLPLIVAATTFAVWDSTDSIGSRFSMAFVTGLLFALPIFLLGIVMCVAPARRVKQSTQ